MRRIEAASTHVDSSNKGVRIQFSPWVVTDMKPAFSINSGMVGGGVINNLAVFGPHSWTTSNSDVWLPTPSNLPNYSAFADGVCAFAIRGANQPTMTNIVTRNVNAGIYLDSGSGHVTIIEPYINGLFGIYCKRNSGDYFIQSGTVSSIFANILIGTTLEAGHYGGISMMAVRVHFGFSPYGIYQVNDSGVASNVSVNGIYDSQFISCRWERIGEAVFCLLDQSVCWNLLVDGFGFSWSPVSRPPTGGWLSNLPDRIIPYDEQQQYGMRLGSVKENVRLGYLENTQNVIRSQYATAPVAACRIAWLQGENGLTNRDLRTFGDDIVYVNKTSGARTRFRYGETIRRSELNQEVALSTESNLCRNPEIAGNWTNNIPTVLTWAEFMAESGIDAPIAMKESLGMAPNVIKFSSAGVGILSFLTNYLASEGRNISYSVWVLAAGTADGRVDFRYQSTPGVFETQVLTYSKTGWSNRAIAESKPPSDLLNFQINVANANSTIYLAGLMVTANDFRAYNPYQSPRAKGGIVLDGGAARNVTSALAILPNDVAGDLRVTARVNSANFSTWRIPFIKTGGFLQIGTPEKIITGVDPITSATVTNNNNVSSAVTFATTAGTHIRWGYSVVPMIRA